MKKALLEIMLQSKYNMYYSVAKCDDTFYTEWAKKVKTPLSFAFNFVKSGPIFKVLTLLERIKNSNKITRCFTTHLKYAVALPCKITQKFKLATNM